MGPVNGGLLDQVGVVAAHRGLHHLLDEVVGELGQGCPELGSSVGLELGLSPEKLSDVDVGQARLLRYLIVRQPRQVLHLL